MSLMPTLGFLLAIALLFEMLKSTILCLILLSRKCSIKRQVEISKITSLMKSSKSFLSSGVGSLQSCEIPYDPGYFESNLSS